MISKELLSMVLDKKVIPSHEWDNNLEYSFMINGKKHSQHINIYELAHTCKEWAFNNGNFILQSAYIPKGTFTSAYCITQSNFSYPKYDETFHADTEPEATFQACQWILDNKDLQ